MASITSLSNSSYNTSSIYGNRNVLSGLASGMDTESMIENAVSGIKTKIQNLQKKRTKIEWQQEAYRSIIDKAVNFNTKYTSYSSKTNLLSSSFFNNAVNTVAKGTYADKITASGKTTSDIRINAVKQLAKAASYTVSGLDGAAGIASGITGGKDFDFAADMDVSTVSGTLSLQYGGTNGTTFDIKFDELENLNEMEGANNTEKLANAINKKLSEITYSYTKNGFQETTTADKAIKAVANADGRIVFEENELNNGNDISISAVSGEIKNTLGISKDAKVIPVGNTELSKKMSTMDYISNKELGISLNGVTKKISMSEVIDKMDFKDTDTAAEKNEKFVKALQGEIDDKFGKNKDGSSKITVSRNDGRLSFATADGGGDTLALGGTAVEALGFESGDTNYINTGKKLSDLLGDRSGNVFTQANRLKGDGSVTQKTSPNGSTYYLDSKGNYVDKDGYRVDKDGKAIYDFEVNGAHINVTEDTTLESLMNSINSNADAGVKVSYSKLTNEFKFTATETGSGSRVEFGKLGEALFGDTQAADARYEKGQDAVMDVEINGKKFENLTRSSNSFEIDGLTINVKGEFKAEGKDGADYEPITFETTTDTDKIVDTIRDFVNDYNEMITEIKNAYSTLPAQKSNGAKYEPLTAEQEDGYSESELKAYNEKAKQGILFGDSTLSSMYSKMLSAITPGGTDGQALREIGIGSSYSNGLTTISLDEDKLRAALESNPDKVRNAFTKTKEGSSSSDGLMKTMQNTLETYVKTTGEPKGVLIQRAGSAKAYTSLNNNSLKTQMDSIDSQIDRWQDKMADQIDRYTTKFSRLEQLIAEMNSQTSAMMGLMGGSSGY